MENNNNKIAKDIDGNKIEEGHIIEDVVGKFQTTVFLDKQYNQLVAGSGFLDDNNFFIPCTISDSPFFRKKKIVGKVKGINYKFL